MSSHITSAPTAPLDPEQLAERREARAARDRRDRFNAVAIVVGFVAAVVAAFSIGRFIDHLFGATAMILIVPAAIVGVVGYRHLRRRNRTPRQEGDN